MSFDNSFSLDLQWVREEWSFGKGTERKGDD